MYKLLHSKGNYKQDKKITFRMGENICKWSNWQRMNLQNMQAAQMTQYQKTINQQMGGRPKQTFLQRHVDGQQIHEKMLNITLEKCKSKLQWGTTSHWSEWPSSKNLQEMNAAEGVENREPSCTVGGNIYLYNH